MAEEKQVEKKNVEKKDGKKVLGGVFILVWVVTILSGVGLMSVNFSQISDDFFLGPFVFSIPIPRFSWIVLAVFIATLVGLYQRKAWAVPMSRASLVVTMVVFFPIGTIFGAILWKRVNDPLAKEYLNYKEEKTDTKE